MFYEFETDIECVGQVVASIDVAADVSLIWPDEFEVGSLYVYIGMETQTAKNPDGRKSDLRHLKVRDFGAPVTLIWREIPRDDPYYEVVAASLARNHDDMMTELRNERIWGTF